jgi:glucose/mannose transport system substrate-binding protein
MTKLKTLICATALVSAATAATATTPVELEVTHWWTSSGESAAVAEFAKAFDATGNTWVDRQYLG